MILIQSVERDSTYLTKLYQWFDSEWDDVEPSSSTKNGKFIPNPIVVLKDGELVGGLIFSRFISPLTQLQAVWINAVFIKPEHRKQGISSQLINHAEQVVTKMSEAELFVLTHIPALYSNLNWKIIETSDEDFILKSSLVRE